MTNTQSAGGADTSAGLRPDEPELSDWTIAVTMVRRTDGQDTERTFTTTMPAANAEEAEAGGYEFGCAINQTSDYQWKFPSRGEDYEHVTVTPAQPQPATVHRTRDLDLYTVVATAQATRWGYTETLTADALAEWIGDQATNPNMRADVDTILAAASTTTQGKPRPTVTVLCGSTRFSHTFREQNLRLTLAGHIVLSIGCDMRSDTNLFAALDEQQLNEIKTGLDELHKRKIDLADDVLVLNVGGYIGDSTRNEIDYAIRHGKPVRFLEPCTKTHAEHAATWTSWRDDCEVCGYGQQDLEQCANGHPDDGVDRCGACGLNRKAAAT